LPVDGQLIPCVFDTEINAPVALSPDVYPLLLDASDEVRRKSPQQLAGLIGETTARRPGAAVPFEESTMFVPEVFYERRRARFYTWLCGHASDRVHALAYDFIPYLEPAAIGVKRGGDLMYYLRTMQAVRKIGFISAKTRDDYINRIVRDSTRGGPVFTLGADAWTAERQRYTGDRRTFVCLGSIDGRKNQHLILRAFQRLWADDIDVELVLVGDYFDPHSHVAHEIELAKGEPRLRHLTSITDDEIAGLMRRARASLYVSSVEGYGLPPVESLASGVPVIAAASVPSIAALEPGGHIRLPEPTVAAIEGAVRRMMNETEASRLWDEAARLALPSWSQTAKDIAQWLES
jgi:glycosyltransferase involved in cell wall biosynthesis